MKRAAPYHVEYIDGEAISSFAIRFCRHGRLSMQELLEVGLDLDRRELAQLPFSQAALDNLSVIASVSRDRLEAAALHRAANGPISYEGEYLPDFLVQTASRRVAPGMLANDAKPYVRKEWQISCLPCDVHTGELLKEVCSQCGKSLYWHNATLVECCIFCGHDIRRDPPQYLAEPLLQNARRLSRLIHKDRSELARGPMSVLASMQTGHILGFFDWFNELRWRSQALPSYWKPVRDKERVLPASPYSVFRGCELAANWPVEFARIVKIFELAFRRARSRDKIAPIRAVVELHCRINGLPWLPIREAFLETLYSLIPATEHDFRRLPEFDGKEIGFLTEHRSGRPIPSTAETRLASVDTKRCAPLN